MSGTRQMLLDFAGEFSGVPAAKLDRFIGYAVTELGTDGATTFGDKYAHAVCFLAAHYLAINSRGEKGYLGSGRVTSQTKHNLGYAPQLLNTPESDEAYRATPYGMQFISIRNSLAATLPRTITSGS